MILSKISKIYSPRNLYLTKSSLMKKTFLSKILLRLVWLNVWVARIPKTVDQNLHRSHLTLAVDLVQKTTPPEENLTPQLSKLVVPMDGMEKFTIPTHTSVVTEKSSKRLITLSAFSPDLNVIRLMHFTIKFSIPILRKYLWSIRTPKHFIQQIKYHYFRPIGKQINGVLIGRKILFRKWLDFQRNRLDFDSKIKKMKKTLIYRWPDRSTKMFL